MSQRPRGLPNILTLLTLLPYLVLCMEAQALCRDPCMSSQYPKVICWRGQSLLHRLWDPSLPGF